MSQLNTIKLRDELIKRITDFALDDHFVSDDILREGLRKIWSGRPEFGGLGSDLWVEGAFPSTAASETMGDLIKRGLVKAGLGKQLNATGAFPSHLKPYTHQLESIEAAARHDYPQDARPAIVVTAGTGAGKTESFLVPMLNELWGDTKEPKQGMSALILYPMNALVNDQVGRLDKWLSGQKEVSFFHFTSETPEDAKKADARGLPKATPAKFRTREQARGREDEKGKFLPNEDGPTPDIVVTNYSMLEYMLCRPQDAVFFGSNLQVVILDEAHIYSGNLAAEITLLLRRVLMRCGRKPEDILFIATSATIGGGAEELKPFAAKLFSKPVELVRVIKGQPQRPHFEAIPAELPLKSTFAATLSNAQFPDEDTVITGKDGAEFRTASNEAWAHWQTLFQSLGLAVPSAHKTSKVVGPLLAETLTNSSVAAALQQILWNDGRGGRFTLEELSRLLFGNEGHDSIEATRRLLQMGAIARTEAGGLPLLPNRMHYLMRGPEGIQISFGEGESEAIAEVGEGRIFSNGADPTVVGNGAKHPLTLFRCNESGWWGVAGYQNNGVLDPVPLSKILYGADDEAEDDTENQGQARTGKIKFFSLEKTEGTKGVIYFDPSNGTYSSQTDLIPLWEVDSCPLSGKPFSPDKVGWFAARARLQLSVLAETALAAMPEYPDENRVWKPARGRRLLVFSDSRAEAARLGPRLTRQHELQVFRAAVLEELAKFSLSDRAAYTEELRRDILTIKKEMAHANPARLLILKRRLQDAEAEFAQGGANDSVANLISMFGDSEILKELYDVELGKTNNLSTENVHDIWKKNAEAIVASLPSLLGRELARRPSWPNPSLETFGLVEITYPGIEKIPAPNEILGNYPTICKGLEKVWPDYLAALLDAVRNQGAITLGSEEADRDYQYGNGLLGKCFGADQTYRREMIPLIGEHFTGNQVSRRNEFTVNILKSLGLPEDKAVEVARELMHAAFEALQNAAKEKQVLWLKLLPNQASNSGKPVPALQIGFQNLGLQRPAKFFRCKVTGQIWPRSVLGFYPGAKKACLEEISSDDVNNEPRISRRRRELIEWQGFKLGLWAEEHSAQLSPEENARLQNLFREGMRNILSSTTTLELGIDIGGLSAVLLGNLPPGKANYLQRAGRAGRRADGTSAVIGFARPSTYEREVFLNFRDYLDRDLRRPTVFLDRAPLVTRHAHAWLLGEFFRKNFRQGNATGAMDAFGRMGSFTGQPSTSSWRKNDPKPSLQTANANLSGEFIKFLEELRDTQNTDLLEKLNELWKGCPNLLVDAETWADTLGDFILTFEQCVENWQLLYKELVAAWEQVPASDSWENRRQADAIHYQLQTLYRLTVIEALADARFLPRYGFPIGLSRLRVQVPDGNNRVREEDQFRLQRDSMMALGEYAPGSQLLVGGKIVTSRGLLKHWTGALIKDEAWGLRGRFKKSNDFFDYSLDKLPPLDPPGSTIREEYFLLPKHGFTTAAWDAPRFGSDFERVGKLEKFTLAFNNPEECDAPQTGFGEVAGLVVTYRNGGELFLLNSGAEKVGFAICQKCGFAESEWKRGGKGRIDLPKGFERHAPLNSARPNDSCWSKDEAPPVWRYHHLAAKQSTHLLRFDFSGMGAQLDRDVLYTVGQALRIAAAKVLELDEREIGIIPPVPDSQTRQYSSVILYDSLAGGSGHLAELSHPENAERATEWLRAARELLTVSGEMPDAVRKREATRRLLTADCEDEKLDPERALSLLRISSTAA